MAELASYWSALKKHVSLHFGFRLKLVQQDALPDANHSARLFEHVMARHVMDALSLL